MPEGYYRTGQAAKQLGVSSYHIRRLCEAGAIAAEISDGQQWRIPASEIMRLKKEGLPPVPQDVDEDDEEEEPAPRVIEVPEGLYADPSADVIEAAEEVKIVENRLRKRRLEREAEEVEDWFRERERRQADEAAAERQKAEAAHAEQRRREWLHRWTQYGLDSLPYGAPREAELEVHAAIEQALAQSQLTQPDSLTRRLVNAAAEKALRPWKRQQEIQRALEAAINKLPWEVRYRSEYAVLKQRAWEAAVAALGKIRAEAGYPEMETAAVQAVQPMIREHTHVTACQNALSRIYFADGGWEEQEEAKEAVRKTLAALPIGATEREIERAKQSALAPFEARAAQRKEAARLEADQQQKRREAEWQAGLELNHIERYLQQEYEFEGGYFEMRREAERLRPLVREALIEELLENPDMSSEEIRESIEDLVEEHL
jgi:excisionase family DNA binding protein